MFLTAIEEFPQRRDHPPVVESEGVYMALAALQIGEIVPPSIYVSDYTVGSIPAWTVRSREQHESGYLILVLIDPNVSIQATLWEPAAEAARNIHAAPGRILATQHYQLRPGCGPMPMLCDLMQQAKYVAGDEQRALQKGNHLCHKKNVSQK